MKRETLRACLKKANELCVLIETLERENSKAFEEHPNLPSSIQNESIAYTRKSAQVKRTSMDLTHLLADLRLNR